MAIITGVGRGYVVDRFAGDGAAVMTTETAAGDAVVIDAGSGPADGGVAIIAAALAIKKNAGTENGLSLPIRAVAKTVPMIAQP